MTETWEGRRVLVTGASSGIGAALAREFAAAGAVVGLCARRTELLDAVLQDCRQSVPECRSWTLDLAELDALDGFVAQVEVELGGIDVLVNNAARTYSGDASTMPWADVEYLTRLNYLSPVRLTRAALPSLRRRGNAHVVTLSSMAARMSTPGEAAYGATKAALASYFEALAGELWDEDVHFHLVYPALIDLTPGVDGDDTLADTTFGNVRIPAPVLARDILGQIERGDLELYMPHTMKDQVAKRAQDVQGAVEFMAGWYRSGSPH
jgi:short-subunit dehydrogenase